MCDVKPVQTTIFMGKPERKRQSGIPWRRWKYYITVGLSFCVNVDWTRLGHGMVCWWSLVMTEMHIRVPMAVIFMTSCGTISISS